MTLDQRIAWALRLAQQYQAESTGMALARLVEGASEPKYSADAVLQAHFERGLREGRDILAAERAENSIGRTGKTATAGSGAHDAP